MAAPFSVVLTTVPNSRAATRIAANLLKKRLAACVSQAPRVQSSYWWKEKIAHAGEILLFIKTRTSLVGRVMECVEKNHPYSVPEIISLPVAGGSKPYLDWIRSSTHPPRATKR